MMKSTGLYDGSEALTPIFTINPTPEVETDNEHEENYDDDDEDYDDDNDEIKEVEILEEDTPDPIPI